MAEQTSSKQATRGLRPSLARCSILLTAQPMWCPCCQSRSPLVAIQPEGLVCAQCQVEVVFGEPAEAPRAEAVPLSGPRLLAAEAAAELQLGMVEDVTLSTLEALQVLAAGTGEVGAGEGSVSTLPASATKRFAAAGRTPFDQTRKSSSPDHSHSLTSFPADQPLYRFDSAHPPVGGRTKAAIEQQRAKFGGSEPTAKQPPATPAAVLPAVERPAEKLPAPRTSAPPMSSNVTERVAPVQSQIASPTHQGSATATAAVAPPVASSEFAIRRVPRSFLLPRSTNRWPGRLCMLSGSLFIAGQCWLLWSFLRGESLGVAGGILASAWSFAMALYVIARYCDEDLEQR